MQASNRVRVLDINSDGSVNRTEWEGNWNEFVDSNIDTGMERDEIEGVAKSIDSGEMYNFGNGMGLIKLNMESEMKDILQNYGEYNFEERDGEFGAVYGERLLRQTFPDAYRVKGMSCFYVPTIGTVVVTCRTISLIRKTAKNGTVPKSAE
jgi:hypothetical protein